MLASTGGAASTTVSANPGVATRGPSPYGRPPGVTGPEKHVFHRHILEHEDKDMMRPYEAVEPAA